MSRLVFKTSWPGSTPGWWVRFPHAPATRDFSCVWAPVNRGATTQTGTVVVILNPAASSGAGARVETSLRHGLEARGVSFELWRTEGPGDAVSLADRAVRLGARSIVAVGGDGTIHEVANGLLRAEGPAPPIGVVPVGTGNDFYRMVGAPRDLGPALDTLTHGTARSFDVGRVRWPGGERYFVNLFGVGIDVAVLERREGVRRLRGLAQYLVALVGAVVRFRPVPLRVRIEGAEVIEARTMLAAVTVGPSIGGGFMLSPTATADDGFLDLCFIDRLNPLQIARVVPRVIRGTHGSHPLIHVRRLRSARFEAPTPEPLRFELDGELVDGSTEWIEVDIVPQAIQVMVPA